MIQNKIRITLKTEKLFLKEGFNTELNETEGKQVLLQYCVTDLGAYRTTWQKYINTVTK